MRARLGKLGAALAALAALAFGGAALASAAGGSHAAMPTAVRPHLVHSHAAVRTLELRASVGRSGEDPIASEGENGSAAEPDSDAAAQAAACQNAGIDPNADNVQYDDQSGVCSLDTGSNAGGNTGA